MVSYQGDSLSRVSRLILREITVRGEEGTPLSRREIRVNKGHELEEDLEDRILKTGSRNSKKLQAKMDPSQDRGTSKEAPQ